VHVTADGIELFVESIGTGTPILMIHGGPGMDHAYFRPDFDRLAEDCRVVYFDQRGNGRSGQGEERTTIPSLAADAAEVIAGLGPSAIVVGHSFGGFVAQELALAHPEVVAKLVLLSTTPGQLGAADDPAADQGPPPPAEVVEIMSQMPSSDEEYAAAAQRMYPHYMVGDPAPLIDRTRDVVIRLRPMLDGFTSLSSWSSVDRLASLAMPVLLIVGEQDVVTSRQQSERIARLVPQAGLHVTADVGHFPWLEAPDEFFAILRAFLTR